MSFVTFVVRSSRGRGRSAGHRGEVVRDAVWIAEPDRAQAGAEGTERPIDLDGALLRTGVDRVDPDATFSVGSVPSVVTLLLLG